MIDQANLVFWYLLLLFMVGVLSNHNRWWTCTTECQRCKRTTNPTETWISEYYSELFSSEPKTAFFNANSTNVSFPDIPNNQSTTNRSGCCETEFSHWAPNETTDGIHNYTVVRLQNEIQFIPVGRCRSGSTCGQGTCVQILRAHWILVYNNTKHHTTAPVNFIPIRIPSHCECLNIGRATP